MLDEDCDEAFERTAHGTVYNDRAMSGIVLARVFEIETFWGVVVELNRAQLPRTSDRVSDIEVDFRTVERAVAFLHFVRATCCFERCAKRSFCAIPQLIVANALRRTRCKFELGSQSECFVMADDELHEEVHFFGNLIGAQVDVTIVLRELAHAREPRQRT